ncbi:MAG TPA: outer membrane lipoprotein carrier protein LolA [Aestuariivirgaceae bacterium]|jgi:outer membrane lipoprotein-sorting protein
MIISHRVCRKLAAVSLIAAALALGGPAGTSLASSLSAEAKLAVEDLSEYFNSFKTLQGEFTQVSPQGRVSTGVFYLSKPGRLRFEYAPPNPFLVVSDGSWVVIENRKQKTTDQYPLAATPLKLLLSNQIDLMEEAEIKSVETSEGVATIEVEDRNRAIPGRLVLVFDTNRKELSQWIVEDAKGKRTTISLANLETGVDPDPKLFVAKVAKRKSNR